MKTKHEFLLQLRHFMTYRFSVREIHDTLEDFNGFFDAGMKEGKTEEELCLSFGNPRDIAKQLITQDPRTSRGLSLHMLVNLVLAFLTCGFCIWMLANSFRINSPASFSYIPILSLAAILLSEGRTFPADTTVSRFFSRAFLFLQVLSCILASILVFSIWKGLSSAASFLPEPLLCFHGLWDPAASLWHSFFPSWNTFFFRACFAGHGAALFCLVFPPFPASAGCWLPPSHFPPLSVRAKLPYILPILHILSDNPKV